MINITKQSSDFVSSIEFDDLPVPCIEAAKIGMTDCVGVMIAGAQEETTRIVAAMASLETQPLGSPEIPSGRLLAAPDAALVNGVAAHVLDYDDVALAAHPSAALMPAILAEGWTLNVSGKDAITAYVAAYEFWAQLDAFAPGRLHMQGFHPTAVLGTLAAAAACARLHRLDSVRTGYAIGIAASLAAGLVANFGTMTKSLHVGRAAQSGILAARLAARGFTSSPDILEHPTGFLRAHLASGGVLIEDTVVELGGSWRLANRGVNIKRYPTCYATHRCIDAMLSIVQTHRLTPDQVAKIDVRTGSTQLLLLRHPSPQNSLEAKFSMEFAMAAALVAKRVGLSELTNQFVDRADVKATFAKVRCTTTDERMVEDEMFAPDDRVSVTLTSGTMLTHAPVVNAKGSWRKRLTRLELQEKFFDCATRGLPAEASGALFDQLWSLDSIDSLRKLRIINPGETVT